TPGSTAPAPSQPHGPSPGAATSGMPSLRPVRLADSRLNRPTTVPAATRVGASRASTPQSSQSSGATSPAGTSKSPTNPEDERSTVAAPALSSPSRSATYPAAMTQRADRAKLSGCLSRHHAAFGARYG